MVWGTQGSACAPGGMGHPQTHWEWNSKVKDTSLKTFWKQPGGEAEDALSSLLNSFLGQVKVTITLLTFQQHRAKQGLSNQHRSPGEAGVLPKNCVGLIQIPGAFMEVWGCLLPFPPSLPAALITSTLPDPPRQEPSWVGTSMWAGAAFDVPFSL